MKLEKQSLGFYKYTYAQVQQERWRKKQEKIFFTRGRPIFNGSRNNKYILTRNSKGSFTCFFSEYSQNKNKDLKIVG